MKSTSKELLALGLETIRGFSMRELPQMLGREQLGRPSAMCTFEDGMRP